MDALFADEQFWGVVGYILGAALALAVGLLSLRFSSKWAAETWYFLRQYEPQIKAAVDQGSDTLPRMAAKVTPWPDTPEQWAALFTGLLSAAYTVLPKAPPTPPEPECVK